MNRIKSILLISIILLITLLSSCASVEVRAAKKGDIESLQKYLDKGGDVNEPQKDGATLLMFASEAGQIPAIKLLLDNGAIISLKDNKGHSAFIYAVVASKQDAAQFLLQRGADVNIILPSGDSALTLVAQSQNQNMMKMLLENGADLNHKNNGGWSALTLSLSKDAQRSSGINQASTILIDRNADLDIDSANVRKVVFSAVTSGNKDVVKYLLDLGLDLENKSDKGETLLLTAVSAQKIEMVRFLLDRGADLSVKDSSGWSILMKSLYNSASAGEGPDAIAQLLMDKGARPEGSSPQGESTAYKAVEKGAVEILSLLLDSGLSPNLKDSEGWSILMKSLYNSASAGEGPDSIAQLLMNKGARPEGFSPEGEITAYKAAETGAVDILSLLLDNGLSTSIRDAGGNSLLMIGVAHTNIVKLLIAWGAPVDARNEQRNTPLIMAAAGGHRDSFSLLLQAGAEPDLRDNNGRTALLYAAGTSDFEMVRELLIAGASPHTTDKSGNTALHTAAAKGVPETVRLLLTSGTYVDSTNSQGETPYVLTYENEKHGTAIREILEIAGAKVSEPVAASDAAAEAQSNPGSPAPVPVPAAESAPAAEPAPEPQPVPQAESEAAVQPDLTVRFGWPSINPSALSGWNNSDKIIGTATLQIGYSSESSWFYEYTMDIPKKGVNADRYEADLDFGNRPLGPCKAVLTIPTRNGNALVGGITSEPDQDGRMILYFEDFEYKK